MVGTRKVLLLVPQLLIRDDPDRATTVSHLHMSVRVAMLELSPAARITTRMLLALSS